MEKLVLHKVCRCILNFTPQKHLKVGGGYRKRDNLTLSSNFALKWSNNFTETRILVWPTSALTPDPFLLTCLPLRILSYFVRMFMPKNGVRFPYLNIRKSVLPHFSIQGITVYSWLYWMDCSANKYLILRSC